MEDKKTTSRDRENSVVYLHEVSRPDSSGTDSPQYRKPVPLNPEDSQANYAKQMHPIRTWLCAVFAVVFFISLGLGVIGLPLMIYYKWEIPLLVPCLYGVAGAVLMYIFFALETQCSVCRMKLFYISRTSHAKDAHHWPLLGYIFPTALRMALLGRCKCPMCGTGITLWKK